ncbi:MAG: hypothetical protein ACKPJO_23680 [Dolichospermum sp.]
MKFRYRNIGCINIFLSGLVTAIALNYLLTGFIDFILNINHFILWLEKSGILTQIKHFFGLR